LEIYRSPRTAWQRVWDDISLEPSMEMTNGCLQVPNKPGLGVEVDEDALRKHEYRERPTKGINFRYEP
jgi:L-alanine-DL-glutamate epimerase-like enolase superfamily enzyme